MQNFLFQIFLQDTGTLFTRKDLFKELFERKRLVQDSTRVQTITLKSLTVKDAKQESFLCIDAMVKSKGWRNQLDDIDISKSSSDHTVTLSNVLERSAEKYKEGQSTGDKAVGLQSEVELNKLKKKHS